MQSIFRALMMLAGFLIPAVVFAAISTLDSTKDWSSAGSKPCGLALTPGVFDLRFPAALAVDLCPPSGRAIVRVESAAMTKGWMLYHHDVPEIYVLAGRSDAQPSHAVVHYDDGSTTELRLTPAEARVPLSLRPSVQ